MPRTLNEIANDLDAAHRTLKLLGEAEAERLGGDPARGDFEMFDEQGRLLDLSTIAAEVREHAARIGESGEGFQRSVGNRLKPS
ncbi:hypothetical protein [Aureimonas mangrovi]|uniref:hypothetical protein n=1 Tax=Aureimonas mangrovi TaxID=2758041 RepID=UPI00163D764C|nr:hypothetical protein [Aureimonas mangrovi]